MSEQAGSFRQQIGSQVPHAAASREVFVLNCERLAQHSLAERPGILALENRERGVRFNCIAPGIIDTPDNRRAMPKADPSRWTSPEAIAKVVVFLLSPDSAPITGAIVPVDGPV